MGLVFVSTILLLWSTASVTLADSYFTCTYYRQNNRIDCWDNSQKDCSGNHLCASCSTQDLSADQESKGFRHLVVGKYLVGPFYEHGDKKTPWFNLYQQKQDGKGNRDFYTKNPENECHGGYALHLAGTNMEGCIAVEDKTCFGKIKSILAKRSSVSKDMGECRTCFCLFWSCHCLRGQSNVKREYIGELLVQEYMSLV